MKIQKLLILSTALFVAVNVAGAGEKSATLPKLLDLGAHKCIPCQKMAPILDELTEEYEGVFDVEFVDVWKPENKSIAQKHGIRSIPTQIFFDADGKELWRHVGYISKEDILKKWVELGFSFAPIRADQQNPLSSRMAEEPEQPRRSCCGR